MRESSYKYIIYPDDNIPHYTTNLVMKHFAFLSAYGAKLNSLFIFI